MTGVAPGQADRRLHLAGRRHRLGATAGQSVSNQCSKKT